MEMSSTGSVYNTVLIFHPQREPLSENKCGKTLTRNIGKIVRRIPYLKAITDRPIVNAKFKQQFDANVQWNEMECFTAVKSYQYKR